MIGGCRPVGWPHQVRLSPQLPHPPLSHPERPTRQFFCWVSVCYERSETAAGFSAEDLKRARQLQGSQLKI